jgi:hypothetical protein
MLINKNSLQAMADSCAILKFKTWEGWTLRYAVVQRLAIEKVGTHDNYYSGSMTLEEVPVLSANRPTDAELRYDQGAAQNVYKALYKPVVDFFTGGGSKP